MMANNPYITTTITCAAPNCGKVKGEVNRWWLIRRFVDDAFTLYPWSDDRLRVHMDQMLPVCGEACVIKMASMFMSELKSKSDNAVQDVQDVQETR